MPSHQNVNRPAAAPTIPPLRPTVDVALLDDLVLEDELLVEEVSIDGMCGVY